MDAKFFFTDYPYWIDFENEEYIICGDSGKGFTRFANGFLVMTKYHPMALANIKRMTDNIKDRYYPVEMLNLTGPDAVMNVMRDSNMFPHPFRCEVRYVPYEYQG